uniref:Uncharacterized protein n=1 Tax=Anguilla anguilla TaxID=7936 RepID=A0A0E9QHN6_ANGAN
MSYSQHQSFNKSITPCFRIAPFANKSHVTSHPGVRIPHIL